jgi:hypothetical protein
MAMTDEERDLVASTPKAFAAALWIKNINFYSRCTAAGEVRVGTREPGP